MYAAMKAAVQIADALQVALGLAQRLVVLLLGKLTQFRDAFRRDPSRRARCTIRFQERAKLEHILAVSARPLRDDRTLVGNELQQSFSMQFTRGFTNRRATYARGGCH